MVGSPAWCPMSYSLGLAEVWVATTLPPARWAVALRSPAEADPARVVATVATSARASTPASVPRRDLDVRTFICAPELARPALATQFALARRTPAYRSSCPEGE